MKSISDYKKRVNKYNGVKGAVESHDIFSLNLFIKDSPSYYEIYINDSSTPVGVQIVDDSDTKDQKEILSIGSFLTVGDVYTWKSEHWLNILQDDMGGIYQRGTIRQCYTSIKWLDSNGAIREAWFALKSDTPSNFGIQDGRVISMPNERRHIIVQSNEHTQELKKDKRFIFDNRVWKIISVDGLINGIMTLTLEEDLLDSAKDNLELRIANYYGEIAIYFIMSLDGNKITEKAGRTHQINSQVLNNGEVDNTQTILYQSSNENIATVDEDGLITTIANGNSTITLSLESDPTIKTTITLTVQLATLDNYTVAIIGSNEITMGFEEHYQIEVRNNGVLDIGKGVSWSLLDQDGVSTTTLASFTNNQFTQCKVKGNDIGYVKLKCVLQGYSAVTNVKTIQIKSIL